MYGVSASGRSTCRFCLFSGDSSRFYFSRRIALLNDVSSNSRHLARMAFNCVFRLESDFSRPLCNNTYSSNRRPPNPYRFCRLCALTSSNDLPSLEQCLYLHRLTTSPMLYGDIDTASLISPTTECISSCECRFPKCSIITRRLSR